MPAFPLLNDLLILLALSVGVVTGLHRRGHPVPILGLLAAGVVSGPAGRALIRDLLEAELLADLGVVLPPMAAAFRPG